MKRILLTGSNGLLGNKIVNLLAERDHVRLMATSRGINRHPLQEGYEYEPLDLTDHVKMAQLIRDFQPDDIIHGAAMTQVDVCEEDKEMCDAVNVESVRKLTELASELGSRLTYISTDFIFDGTAGPYKETDTPNPVNYYGHSKLKAEQIVQASGNPYAILRTILLYGITRDMSRSNIVLWVRKKLMSGESIRVVDDQYRCPTLVEDLAQACVSTVMKQATGIYHISGAEMMSIIELARTVADFWKLDGELIQPTDSKSLGQRATRPPITGFIILKAQSELGYRPHSLRQGLELMDRQMREHRHS